MGPAQVEALLMPHLWSLSADMSVLLEHGQVLRKVQWQVLNLELSAIRLLQ